jgi:hypothetical protein
VQDGFLVYRKTGLLNLLGLVKLSVSTLVKDIGKGSVHYWVDIKKFPKRTKVCSSQPSACPAAACQYCTSQQGVRSGAGGM